MCVSRPHRQELTCMADTESWAALPSSQALGEHTTLLPLAKLGYDLL